jgi:hypothetical protein
VAILPRSRRKLKQEKVMESHDDKSSVTSTVDDQKMLAWFIRGDKWQDVLDPDEPDIAHWRHCGLDCVVFRHTRSGHLCGYVGVPKGHYFYEVDYTDPKVTNIDVHGGLSFAGPSFVHKWVDDSPLLDDVWLLGFDCNHAWDCPPGGKGGYECWYRDYDYRDIKYVVEQANFLADQLIRLIKEAE